MMMVEKEKISELIIKYDELWNETSNVDMKNIYDEILEDLYRLLGLKYEWHTVEELLN